MGYVGRSDYVLEKEQNNLHGISQFTMPATTYIALFIGNPLSTGIEVSGGSYARQTVTWGGAVSGTNEYTDDNDGEIAFPEATADWGEVTHAATYDASTAGNMLEVFELATARNVVSGIVVKIADGDLDSHLKRESI